MYLEIKIKWEGEKKKTNKSINTKQSTVIEISWYKYIKVPWKILLIFFFIWISKKTNFNIRR